MAQLMSVQEKRHHAIKSHIKGRLGNGHDILSIKDDLANRGFAHHEIHKAIDLAYEELRKTEQFVEEAERFLHPTKGKLILPIIVVIMLILHFSINIYYLPAIGKSLCNSATISEDIEVVSRDVELGEDLQARLLSLQKRSSGIQKNIIEKYKTIITINFPMTFSKVYKLDPLFNLPCETISLYPSKNCRYYMTEEDYSCINQTKTEDSNIKTLFKDGLPEYKAISGWSVFLNTLIIFLIVYIISCTIAHYHNKFKMKAHPKIKEALEITGVLILILLIIFAVLTYIYLVRLLTI